MTTRKITNSSIATAARNRDSGKVCTSSSSAALTCAEVRRVIKATRTGDFFAFELTSVTKSLPSLIAPPWVWRLLRERAAVPLAVHWSVHKDHHLSGYARNEWQ